MSFVSCLIFLGVSILDKISPLYFACKGELHNLQLSGIRLVFKQWGKEFYEINLMKEEVVYYSDISLIYASLLPLALRWKLFQTSLWPRKQTLEIWVVLWVPLRGNGGVSFREIEITLSVFVSGLWMKNWPLSRIHILNLKLPCTGWMGTKLGRILCCTL